MQSPNKRPMSADEAAYVAIVATLPCAVCGAMPVEIHEFEQSNWFSSCPLCPECHRGPDGWHGTRLRWQLRKVAMLDAIASTVRAVFQVAMDRAPARVSTRRIAQAKSKPTKLGRPEKIVARRVAA